MRLQLWSIVVGVFVVCGCGSSPSSPPPAATAPGATATPVAAPVQADTTQAVVAPESEPTGDIEFKSVLDLKQTPKAGEPELRGGQEANSRDWPASLYATFSTPRGTSACTAALVGPRAMLTAAHCVPSTGIVRFSYEGHQQSYTATCTRHPQYTGPPKDASADYALCTVQPAFAAPVGFKYETVNTTDLSKLIGNSVILTGFGCISDNARNQKTDGKYRIGFNTIDESSSSSTRRRGASFYSPNEDNNVFTTDADNTANLCPGDSGGPLFLRTNAASQLFDNRTIVGVNSRVFFRDAAQTTFGSSLISATGGPDFSAWAIDWAKTAKVEGNARVDVCGLIGDGRNCRS